MLENNWNTNWGIETKATVSKDAHQDPDAQKNIPKKVHAGSKREPKSGPWGPPGPPWAPLGPPAPQGPKRHQIYTTFLGVILTHFRVSFLVRFSDTLEKCFRGLQHGSRDVFGFLLEAIFKHFRTPCWPWWNPRICYYLLHLSHIQPLWKVSQNACL